MVIDYVIQRSLMVVDGDQKDELVAMIRPQLAKMRGYHPYNKHVSSSAYLPCFYYDMLFMTCTVERLLEKCAPLKTVDDHSGIIAEPRSA